MVSLQRCNLACRISHKKLLDSGTFRILPTLHFKRNLLSYQHFNLIINE